MLLHSEVDDLVGDYSHALERQCLDASPWEPLDDPALSLLLIAIDFFFDQRDHDLIINELEVVETLSDSVCMGST